VTRADLGGFEAVPMSLASSLPAVLQDDDFASRWCSGLDPVLAPVFLTLDCIESYVDPALAPDDFLDWLCDWVGIVLDENCLVERRRQIIAGALELYRQRGTIAGLARHVELVTGGTATVVDSGGVAVSATPGAALPGKQVPRLTVRVSVPEPASVDAGMLDRLVAAAKPAHVVHKVEVVAS
jgi:phage tail-like protein